jgi:AcrR family transcriptional regulator
MSYYVFVKMLCQCRRLLPAATVTAITLSLQERKRRVTRDLIERAALALFLERSFEETTIDAIAEAAGVSARTFFRYFAGKEDVLFADHHDEFQVFLAALREQPTETPLPTRVRHALAATAHLGSAPVQEARNRLIATVPVVRGRMYLLGADYETAIAAYVREHDPKTTESEALLAAAAIWGAFMKIPEILFRELEEDPDAVLARACAVLEAGVR